MIHGKQLQCLWGDFQQEDWAALRSIPVSEGELFREN